MAILPYDSTYFTAGQVADGSKVYANDAALETVVDGGLTEANLSGSAQIPTTNLAQPYHTVEVTLQFPSQVNAVAGWAATSGKVHDVVPLPYDATEGVVTYTVLAVNGVYQNTDATTPDYGIEWGHFSAGVWSTGAGAGGTGAAVVASTALASSATPTQVTPAVSTASITTNSSQARMLALVQKSVDVGFSTEGDFLKLTVKLKVQHRA